MKEIIGDVPIDSVFEYNNSSYKPIENTKDCGMCEICDFNKFPFDFCENNAACIPSRRKDKKLVTFKLVK